MKHPRGIQLLGLLLMLMLAGCGSQQLLKSTDYQPEKDVYIVFQGRVIEDATSILPVSLVGQLALVLQEGVHKKITHVSVAKVKYFYIWVCLGEACIPVDPFTYSS